MSADLTGVVTIPKTYFADDWLNDRAATKKSALLDLVTWANDREREITVAGNRLKLKRGQLAYSQSSLSKLWLWDRERVNAFLNELQSEGKIVFKSGSVTTLITILDYEIWNPDTAPDPTAFPAAFPATDTATFTASNPATNPSQKIEVGSKEGGSATPGAGLVAGNAAGNVAGFVAGNCEIPPDSEVSAFAQTWFGDMSRGIPPGIPERWWSGWMAHKLSSGKFPADWRRVMVLDYRADWLNRHPKAHGIEFPKKNGAGSQWGMKDQAEALAATIERHPANPSGTRTSPNPTPAERAEYKALLAQLRELREARAGVAGRAA